MTSPVPPNPTSSTARPAWYAALLGSALAGCASLSPESSAPQQAPAAKPAPTAQAPAQGSAVKQDSAVKKDATQASGKDAAVPSATQITKEQAQAQEGAHLAGFVDTRLIGRWSGSDHDIDLVGLVSVDYSDTRNPWIKAHIVTRVDADLDGRHSGSVFNGLSDLGNEAVDVKLYEAYVDIVPADGLGQLRVGRQYETLTPEIVNYDGGSFRTAPTGDAEFVAGLYGGVPVRLYQGFSENRSVFGAFAEERPWKGGRARVDWMQLDDQITSGTGESLIGLGLWQRFDGGYSAEAQYTRLEQENRDLRLRAQYTSPNAGFNVSGTYYQLYETQNQLPQDIDPYTSIMMELFPYTQYGLTVSSELTEKILLDLSFDQRRVVNTGDLGQFNRDWERYRATTVFRDAFVSHFDASISADFWDGDGNDTTTWGLDLTYDTQDKWKFGAGSYYSLYKYDLLQQSERDDVRTYYARSTCKLGKSLTLELSYDFEADPAGNYNALRGGALWRF